MAKFTVVEPLRHDGKDYQPGAVMQLAKDEAAKLLQRGVIVEGVPPAAEPEQVQPEQPEQPE